MTRFALQFGQTQPGLTYVERISVYGLCSRGEQSLAIVQIGTKAPYEYDLFEEEAGLTVWPTRLVGRAGQFWINSGEPRNSLATFYEVELSASDGVPSEPDHHLLWMTPAEALAKVRHEAHAWAILHWMRRGR
jgi:8-oxo-dGTP diphosphatase